MQDNVHEVRVDTYYVGGGGVGGILDMIVVPLGTHVLVVDGGVQQQQVDQYVQRATNSERA